MEFKVFNIPRGDNESKNYISLKQALQYCYSMNLIINMKSMVDKKERID